MTVVNRAAVPEQATYITPSATEDFFRRPKSLLCSERAETWRGIPVEATEVRESLRRRVSASDCVVYMYLSSAVIPGTRNVSFRYTLCVCGFRRCMR